jgi:hypothetical protein
VDGDDLEGASVIALLATEADAILVRELEMLEGMADTVGPSLDPAKPLRHDAITNDISRDDLASSPARATFSPMADDNYFSPLSSHMDREDLGITRGRVIANRLEPYDFCDEEDMYKETNVNNEDLAGVFACEEDHRPFIHSPSHRDHNRE